MKFKFILIIFVFSSTIAAQTNTESKNSSIRLKVACRNGYNLLRWAVDTPFAWEKANKAGYHVKRYTVSRNKHTLNEIVIKDFGVLKTPGENEWQQIVQKNDNAAIIAQSLFGKTFEVEMGEQQSKIQGIINKSNEIEQRFAYALMAADMDFEVAKFAGWGLKDTTIVPNERYLYLVEAETDNKTSTIIEKGSAITDSTMIKPLPKPIDFLAVFQDKQAKLFWEYKRLEDYYTIYFIEKSADGNNFQPLNNLPVMNMQSSENSIVYIDSISNGIKYYYRIRGKTIFGEFGPYSDIISGTAFKKLENAPRLYHFDTTNDGKVQLQWEFPLEMQPEIDHFEILYSSDDKEGSYKSIKTDINGTKREELIEPKSSTNYYKIAAIGKNGDTTESFSQLVQLNDTIPPDIPTELSGNIDSLGVVHLSWKTNTEEDLEGYHVFRANNQKEDPVRLTPRSIQKTVFTDTVPLKNLNSKIYYCLLAVDNRKNESKLSPLIEIEKPDRVCPQTPVFLDYRLHDGIISLQWSKSGSDDVELHQLYRKAIDDNAESKEEMIYQTKDIQPQYQYDDKNLNENQRYQYHLLAIDRHGLKSEQSQKITLRYTADKPKNVIKSLIGSYNKNKNRIELQWRVTNPEQVTEIKVYRSEANAKPTLWGTLKGAQNFLDDPTAHQGIEYTYLIQAMLKSKQPTKTEKITVQY